MAKNKYSYTGCINDLFKNENTQLYEDTMDEITKYITEDIERRHELCLISFFNEEAREMTLGQYLTYLIILQPFYVYDVDINVDVIPDVSDLSKIEDYYDWCIGYFGTKLGYGDEFGEVLVNITDRLNTITCEMTKKFGPTFDLHTFIELAKRDKRFAEIMYEPEKYIKEHNGEVTPEEIVKHTNDIIKEVQECIVNDDDNNFKNFITSGAGVNAKQLGQVFGYIGLKPDLKEKIIPRPIDTNFVMGLRDIVDYYINAVGCLKALITVKIQTKNSGYLTRKLQMLLNDEYIADVKDCKTKHLLPFEIKDKNHLKHLNNLYYSESDKKVSLKLLSEKDSDLIGKKVYLRTPITCACKHGICKTCYGEMWRFNMNMNIGLIASLIITNMITQTNLSVKHLLQANVLNGICEEILKYFTVEIDTLAIKDEYIDKISLAFSRDIVCDNEGEENVELTTNVISVIDGDNLYDIETNIQFNINPELNDLITTDFNKELDRYVIKGKKLKNYDYIFNYSVQNNSLSGPMLKLKEIIEKNDFIKSHNVFELFYKVIEILSESKSKTDYVHVAVLIKNLMRVNEGRSLFKKKEFPEYTLYSVSDAIQYCSPSISKPLVYERIKDQLLTDKYGTLSKMGYSNYDVLLK